MDAYPEDAVFNLTSVDELKSRVPVVVDCVRKKHYALLRGLFSAEAIRASAKLLYSHANTKPHLGSAGISRELIRTNMSKWSIGSDSTSQSGIARFMLTIYNPLFCQDIFGMHAHFRQLITIRDILAQRQEILFDDKLPAPKFNGARVQIYPKGGGFMTMHRDTRAVENLKGVSDTYIQLVLLLTQRGVDYHSGGAFTVDEEAEITDSEKDTLCGDVLVYDGNSLHGVMDIDPKEPFTAPDIAGRAVALVTVYE